MKLIVAIGLGITALGAVGLFTLKKFYQVLIAFVIFSIGISIMVIGGNYDQF